MFKDAQVGGNTLRHCGSHNSLISLVLREIEELKLDIKELTSALHRRALVFSTGADPLNLDLCVIVINGSKNLSSAGADPLIHEGVILLTLRAFLWAMKTTK